MFEYETQIQCPIHGPTAFVPCPDHEVTPLVEHLFANTPVESSTVFPRGTILPDGRLDLCKQNLGPLGCHRIVEALRSNHHVRSLLLGTDGIGDQGAVSLGQLLEINETLQIVYLGCNGITATGTNAIAESLTGNTSVEGLWLKRNPIGNPGVEAIARLLTKNHSIRVLDLVNTGIGKPGLKLLCDVLKRDDCSIERLYLGGNSLDEFDAIDLARVLGADTRLQSLLLNVGNLGDNGAIAIANGLQQNCTLRELGLASNGITAMGAERLMSAVTRHSSLTRLDLGYSPSTQILQANPNSVGDEGGEYIARMLMSNSVLQRLTLTRTEIGPRGRNAIEAALVQNQTMQYCQIDGGLSESVKNHLLFNRSNSDSEEIPSKDVTLIRSVYRSAR